MKTVKEGYRRRVLDLSDTVWKNLRHEAVEQEKTVSQVAEEILGRKLKRIEKKGVKHGKGKQETGTEPV